MNPQGLFLRAGDGIMGSFIDRMIWIRAICKEKWRDYHNLEDKTMLTIKTTVENNKAILSPEGRVDSSTAPMMESAVKEILPGITDLTIDFEKLEYISSAGLRVLLSAQKTMNTRGKMKVTGVNATITEIFEITGFSDILTIE